MSNKTCEFILNVEKIHNEYGANNLSIFGGYRYPGWITVKFVQQLCGVGRRLARKIRKAALHKLILLYNKFKPRSAILAEKMLLERAISPVIFSKFGGGDEGASPTNAITFKSNYKQCPK